MNRIVEWLPPIFKQQMDAPATLLCIHRDPAQFNLLKEKGYGLLTATNGSDGLRLLMSQAVDAIVIEYYLGLLNGAIVANEIKKVRPRLPIVMVADHLELPEGAVKSVDALVTKSDDPEILLATLRSALQTMPPPQHNGGREDVFTRTGGEDMANPSKRQILVVDDDPSVRESVATLLMSAGYDVVVAEDGFGALSQLRKTLPDVMVSDLDMPGMSGYELLSVVRRRFPRIVTLAMSGAYPGGELPPGVIADGFYAKGRHPKDLFRTLEQLIRSAPAQGSTHHRAPAPVWIPRNGNDSQGMPYVMVTCGECLRAFPINVKEETTGKVVAIPCRFCPTTNEYIIQPSSQAMHEVFV